MFTNITPNGNSPVPPEAPHCTSQNLSDSEPNGSRQYSGRKQMFGLKGAPQISTTYFQLS